MSQLALPLASSLKKVRFDLQSVDSNAFALMGGFQQAARRQGWHQPAISEVLDECRKSDYDHLIQTLLQFTE
jgi:hypothetical protein